MPSVGESGGGGGALRTRRVLRYKKNVPS